MSIYVFSLLVGYEQNGIDNAQGIRNGYLKKTNLPIRYIFTDLPTQREINNYSIAGIAVEDMLCAPLYLTDNYNLAGNVSAKEKVKQLKKKFHIAEVRERKHSTELYQNGKMVVSVVLKENRDSISHIDFFESGKLILSEHYGDRLLYSHYYVTDFMNGHAYARCARTAFVDKNGRKKYDYIYEKGGKGRYVYPNGRIYTRQEFLCEFIKKLKLSEDDLVILDRPSHMDFVQPLFQFGNCARFIAYLHSGHYFLRGENVGSVYINYEYYYWFKYTKYIDWMVVATEEQYDDLRQVLTRYGCEVPKIKAIPTGGLEQLRYPEKVRKRYSLVTVSRLQDHKHVDWVIDSVVRAHEKIPELSLDIYGEGEENYVLQIKKKVKEYNADSYIRFMGYADVRELYTNYEAYISASVFETLGLSLMEAVGSGNAMIGLDVRYGNRLFIEDGKNGKRIPFRIEDMDNPGKIQNVIDKMAEAIVELFSDETKLREYQKYSHEIAERFLNEKIEKQWIDFIEMIERT